MPQWLVLDLSKCWGKTKLAAVRNMKHQKGWHHFKIKKSATLRISFFLQLCDSGEKFKTDFKCITLKFTNTVTLLVHLLKQSLKKRWWRQGHIDPLCSGASTPKQSNAHGLQWGSGHLVFNLAKPQGLSCHAVARAHHERRGRGSNTSHVKTTLSKSSVWVERIERWERYWICSELCWVIFSPHLPWFLLLSFLGFFHRDACRS